MEWTRAARYRAYDQYSALELMKLQAQATASPAQLHYHIRPQSGLLNDPNGFSYFNGEWTVFYQSFPFGAAHGLKSWVRLSSPDLVHWTNHGVAVLPDSDFDSHGAYSGSAHEVDGKLFLMYTGNHRDADWTRTPYQLGAWLDQDGRVTKLAQPLIDQPETVTEHFRDPQLFFHGDRWYALLGAQRATDQRGEMLLYSAPAVTGPWTAVGPIKLPLADLGYMVECPNLISVDGVPTFVFCPQGLPQAAASYQNIYPNMYLQGKDFDYRAATLEGAGELTNLDEGFDVYASQTFNAPDGTAYLISWVGLPDMAYPTDEQNWANCLSQVKELHQVDGQLVQQPVAAMTSLRQEEHRFAGEVETITPDGGQQLELAVTIAANQQGTLYLAASVDRKQSVQLRFDTAAGELVIDRATSGPQPTPDHGTTRTLKLPAKADLKLRLFLDHSLAEVFVNDGRQVATFRYFTSQENTALAFDRLTTASGSWWQLADQNQ